MFDSKNTNPYCGEPIDFQAVRLVDMTGFDMQQDEISAALQKELGSYRLVTDKPVQIPRDYAYWNRKGIKGISGAKSEAAAWGCNLLVLLEVKAVRTGVNVQARNEDRAWMVYVGTITGSP
jgi:hypothetical protein